MRKESRGQCCNVCPRKRSPTNMEKRDEVGTSLGVIRRDMNYDLDQGWAG